MDQITAVLNEAIQRNEGSGVNPQTGLQEFASTTLSPHTKETESFELANRAYDEFTANINNVTAHPERQRVFDELERKFNPSGAQVHKIPTPEQRDDHARIQGIKPEAHRTAEPAQLSEQTAYNTYRDGNNLSQFEQSLASRLHFVGPDGRLYVKKREHYSDNPIFDVYTELRNQLPKSQSQYELYKKNGLGVFSRSGSGAFDRFP